ncbi:MULTISPECIES: ATP-binding protein [unclassified Arthrobacter]|uniref:ATP-binding protein n=1 Tax=unclassified Arthrobacter TaxID=235627 RepID=UPI00254B7E73|nr:LuxR C-terminal-related transcriptional regulator [Arthrobacter sp. fls2-241-R2A-172]
MTNGILRRSAGGASSMTSFVGRRRELAEAKARMAESRLVTLTGPGGVGKTRLALELADRSRKAFRDGVWDVGLASLEDEASVASVILGALSVPDQSARPAVEKLLDYLRERELLVVLDNCEHLLQAAAELTARILQEAQGVRIIATSREPLGIAGERICLIPPLAVPSPAEEHTLESLEQFEAVNLLIDRARSIIPDFAVTAENAPAVVQLCSSLDGIPLAIELAAARLRSLSVTQMVERLERRFQLFTGGDRAGLPRQQTLRALVDWSYELCNPAEQLLWARLSVFPGSFDLESAERVCGFGELDPLEVIDLLDRLVAKSIVLIQRTGEHVRYRQLMTMREYGGELLARGGGYPLLKRRQRDYYLQRSADMVAGWCGSTQAGALAAMRDDHANLISALEWSVNSPEEQPAAAGLASLLRYHWIAGGFLSVGRRWLDRILAQPGDHSPERGAAQWVAAWVALIQGDRDAAAAYLDACEETAAALNDGVLAAHASHWRALHHYFSGNLAESVPLYESAIAAQRKAGDTASVLTALFQLALAQAYGDANDGLATCRQSMELSSRHGERWSHAYSLWVSGLCHWRLGQYAEARQATLEALHIQQEFKDAICTALSIELLSWTAVSESQFELAAELGNAASGVWTGLGTTIDAFGPHLKADSLLASGAVRKHLSPRRLAELAATRARVTKVDAIALALGSPSAAAPDETKSPLTPRESEVARLVGEGLSNRSIAQTLVISPRTVDGHVENILGKLGFNSRAQIAAWEAGQMRGKHHAP